MKSSARKFAHHFVVFLTKLIGYYWNIKNRKKKKILVYTDSRGFEITKLYNRRNPFSSYIRGLIYNYNTDFFVCTEKHTTFFDFIEVYDRNKDKNYDYVVLHCGVVDFSPRPKNQIGSILDLKKSKIVKHFGLDYFEKIKSFPGYKVQYEGESTTSILPEMAIKPIADYLNEINELIWISCNPVDVNWRGNYTKDRPANINIVNESSKILISFLGEKAKIIDMTLLDLKSVHRYTCDNVHLSKEGMLHIENELIKLTK